MKNFSKEIKIGVMVVGAIMVMFAGFKFMKDIPIFRGSHQIYAIFPKVVGLNAGNQIVIRGVKVGTVGEVQLTADDSVKVVLNIEKQFFIPKGSSAKVEALDLLGTKAVVITRGDGIEEVEYGARIKGKYEESVMDQLGDKGNELTASVTNSITELETLLGQLNTILREQNQKQIDSIITNFKGASDSISDLVKNKQSELSNSIALVENILQKMDTLSTQNKQKIDSILVNVQSSSNRLNHLTENLDNTMVEIDEIIKKINEGEGSIGQMINNPSIYNNLDSLTYNLSQIVKKMNEDPRYFLKHVKIVDMF